MSTEIYELMRSRRSVRRFKPEPVARELVERLIDAAITAPSASNKQPWRFFVVEDPGRIARLATAVRESVAKIVTHIPEESRPAFQTYGDYFTRFELAPTLIVPIYRPLTILSNLVGPGLDDSARDAIVRMEVQSGLIGTSLALQNLLLMAHAMGLGASGMTGPLVAAPLLRSILEVPESWNIVAFVPVGWPDETPSPTDRKPVGNVVRWLDTTDRMRPQQ